MFLAGRRRGANSLGKISFRRAKIGLDAAEQMSYSRRLKDSTTNPRGWVCIGDFRDDGIPADREAQGRGHGCKRRASDTLTIVAQAARGNARAARVAERPIAPGTVRVLCPPGTQLFRGPFFCARVAPLYLPMPNGLNVGLPPPPRSGNRIRPSLAGRALALYRTAEGAEVPRQLQRLVMGVEPARVG